MHEETESNYSMTAKKIAVKLTKLPSEEFLAKRLTHRQIKAWAGQRFAYNLISLCWKANLTGKNDPLRNLVEAGMLSEKIYNSCWLWARHYLQLWGLVQLVAPYVEAEARKRGVYYPFKSAFKLFIHIVSEQANSAFSICLQSYREISSSKYEQAYRLASRAYQGEALTLNQAKKIFTNLKQHKPEPWLAFTLEVCRKKATSSHKTIRSQLRIYESLLSEILDEAATHRRKRGSFAWKNGEKGRGTKAGTYDFS